MMSVRTRGCACLIRRRISGTRLAKVVCIEPRRSSPESSPLVEIDFRSRASLRKRFARSRIDAAAPVGLTVRPDRTSKTTPSSRSRTRICLATNSLPHIREGRIKAFAVTSESRLEAAPEIPTVDEVGLGGLHVSVWYGMWAPKATSEAVIARLNSAIVEILADRRLREHFAAQGQAMPAQE